MNWEQIIILTFTTIFIVVMGFAIITVWFEEITAPFKRLFKRKPKYRVGQKVRVKKLKHNQRYGTKDNVLKVWHNMIQYGGSVVTITEVYNNGLFFNIKEDDGDTWHVGMFEPFIIKKEDAFEALLHGHINDEEYTVIMKRRRRC